ncbi:MAG: cation:proton antiporter regulatory subunit, partial [Anaeromyxobacteraceae bacterium]
MDRGRFTSWPARRLGLAIASAALPEGAPGALDLAVAPRLAFVATLPLGTAALVLLPVIAVTEPFVPAAAGAAVLAGALALLGIALWRSAKNLEGHVRAGALVLVEALAKGVAAPHASAPPDALAAFRNLFPGLGEPIAVRVPPGSPAVGNTLSQLAIRGATGATVLAIARGRGAVVVPGAGEVLLAGDLLALVGTH